MKITFFLIIIISLLMTGCYSVNPNQVEGFMFKFRAKMYAKKAERSGYNTKISYTPNWLQTGAKYWVSLEKK